MEVTSISDWAIEDYISLIRFSYSDYTLTHWDYNALSSLRKGDVIRVTGTIENIGGGNWYIELSRITSLKRIKHITKNRLLPQPVFLFRCKDYSLFRASIRALFSAMTFSCTGTGASS